MKEIRLRIFGEAVIEVGDTQVTPASSHIFALLLMLTLGPKDGWTRRELMAMLFEGVEQKEASHRLRQLLYKLRGMGTELSEKRGGLVRVNNSVKDLIDEIAARHELFQEFGGQQTDWILSHYVVPGMAALQMWVDELRDRLGHELRNALLVGLQQRHSTLDWEKASRLGKILLACDPFHLEALRMTVEALGSCGRRQEALILLDNHLALYQQDSDATREAKRLRSRLASIDTSNSLPPLRGRDEQLAALMQRARAAGSSRNALSVVEGAAGIGKSRLAQALADTLATQGVSHLRFACNTHTRHIPLAPFVDVARRLMQMRGALGASPDYASALQRFTTRHHNAPWPSDEAEMVTRRLTIKHALTDLIEAVTSESPFVLLIDDAHLLDEASLDLIRSLSEEATNHALNLVLFLRPGSQALATLAHTPRIFLSSLLPLPEYACRAILDDLPDHRLRSPTQIEHTLSLSGGNPFYLKLLARHEPGTGAHPPEVKSLAGVTYARLPDDARVALEICILLDTVATLPRLELVSGLKGFRLISALRQLERENLLRLHEGRLIGPHTLLHSAIRDAIPTSVRGALHRRIASVLTTECLNTAIDPDLSLAAIQHWLEVRDGASALALARSCVNQAVDLGEPSTAVHLLDSIPRVALAPHAQKSLLDDIIRLADHTKHSSILISSLRERLALAHLLHEDRSAVARMQLRLVTAEHVLGLRYPPPIELVRGIALDASLQPTVRVLAISRLLVTASFEIDESLATEAFECLAHIQSDSDDDWLDTLRSCAALVYHTTYGSRQTAFDLIDQLARLHPSPTMNANTQMARHYAGFAAGRLGARQITRKMFGEELAFAETVAAFGMAEYSALMLAEIAIMDGDYASAAQYLAHVEQISNKRRGVEQVHSPGYFSTAACLAIRQRDFQRAAQLLDHVERSHASVASPYYRAVTLSLLMRIEACRGDAISRAHFEELRSLFARAHSTGGQDSVVESLWRCENLINGPDHATELLRHYLEVQRREVGPVEADLWLATKCDPVWSDPKFAKITPKISTRCSSG